MASPSISFGYGDGDTAYSGSFSDTGFSIGGGQVAAPAETAEADEAAPADPTFRIPPIALVAGGAVALVLILLVATK